MQFAMSCEIWKTDCASMDIRLVMPGLRDRALIGLMVYTFARVGAAVSMRVEDFYVQGRHG